MKKKNLPNLQRITEFLSKKNCHQALKVIGFESGKNLFQVPNQRVKKDPDPDQQN